MDYKNLFFRFFVSLIFLSIYLTIGIMDKNYLFFIVFLLYFFVLFEVVTKFNKKIIIIIYILLSLISFIIYFIYFFDYIVFNFFILTVVTFDIFSYVFGSFFGKTKILPNLSPNKTLEGLIFGIVFSNFLSIIYLYIYNQITLYYLVFLNFIIIFSFMGDMIESNFKRKSLIKNSSNLIPGHGGFFDRIDSFILSINILLIFSLIK